MPRNSVCMKSSLLILLALALSFSSASGQTKKRETVDFDVKGFKPFPKDRNKRDKSFLLSRITPDSAYAYWEYVMVYSDFDGRMYKRDIIASYGDKANYAVIARQNTAKSDFGLLGKECHAPSVCYSYIVGVKDKSTVDVIEDHAKLKTFIGSVDSIDEVMLYALINGYGFDGDTIIGGAYKERENDYLLYLLDYEPTPVTYKSVKAILTKSGEFRVLGKRIYKQTDEYIID